MDRYRFSTTDQYFEEMNFHDCFITSVQAASSDLSVELDYIYISEKHPLNPNAAAKSTDRCRLIFKDVSSVRAELYVDVNPQRPIDIKASEQESKLETRPVETAYLNKMEIETFSMNQSENEKEFILQGIDWKTHEFCGLIVRCEGFIVEWNDFLEDAWYVNFK
ncbi:hypothetical protein [Planomicrobium okeanokoites]|uniref:hypothetical protein n=1 Tax=Planomicrobium okeanokoites TaxID=244 RepID=UPI002491EA78|nr:hypothetical protein [Planomicrobium okeanokoites]